MKNFYKLDIPVKILRDEVDTSTYPNLDDYHWIVWNDNSNKYVTPEGLEFIRSMGFKDQSWFDNKLQPGHVTVFRGKKGQVMDIHCDRGPTWCINLVWGVSDSEMVWYKLKDDVQSTTEMCNVGSAYESYDPNGCVEIERTSFTGPMLTRIDTPHNVINYDSDNYRWCLSIRDVSSKMTWEEAVEHFKPWITQ
jgi:hypothetical protein